MIIPPAIMIRTWLKTTKNNTIPNYDDAVQNHGGWDPCFNVYPAKVGRVIDIILVNEPNGINGGFDVHPSHIHGDHVYDLAAEKELTTHRKMKFGLKDTGL